MTFALVGDNTDTARIDGINAAGANPDTMVHTPSADLKIVEYGHPVEAPVVPVSPTGWPTPAVITHAVRELLGFDLLVATTSFIVTDETTGIRELADDLDVALTVTDPGFDSVSHPAMDAYMTGEAKDDVGMGGALSLAAARNVSMAAVREKIAPVYDRLIGEDVTANA